MLFKRQDGDGILRYLVESNGVMRCREENDDFEDQWIMEDNREPFAPKQSWFLRFV